MEIIQNEHIYEQEDFSGLDLTDEELCKVRFKKCSFKGTRLSGMHAGGACLKNAIFHLPG